MYQYTIHQWLMFFYIYCFLGWCFESAYVSIKQHSPVNRGFLHGPFLPIYGSGAIAILFAALPFKKWPWAVYIAGLISATVLEYIVGYCMEAIFKVRYWDYSYQKYNLHGYICLSSSIAWGFFSDLLIYGIHEPIAKYVLAVPSTLLGYITFGISIAVTADFIQSLRTALDIRNLIVQAEKLEEEMNRYKRRMEIIDTVARADFENRVESFESRMEEYGSDIKEHLTDSMKETNNRIEALRNMLSSMQDEKHIPNIEELGNMRMSMELWKERLYKGFSRDKMSMLKRNPGAVFKKMPNLLDDFRNGRNNEQE